MKIKPLLFLLAIACYAAAQAQPQREIRRFEGELGGGVCFKGAVADAGPAVFGEGRYNFGGVPVDLGIHISFNAFDSRQGDYLFYHFMAVSDYNVRIGGRHALFFGAGAGIGHFNAPEQGSCVGNTGLAFVFMPRVGIELFRHLRLAFDCKLMGKGYSHAGLSLGIAFGGGARRKGHDPDHAGARRQPNP